MGVVEPGTAGKGLLARTIAVLLGPSRFWDAAALESVTLRDLFRGHVAPLAAVPAVCGLVGMRLFGEGIFGIGIQASWTTTLIDAAVGYGLTLASVFLLGLLIESLAPVFGGVRDRLAAMKLAAYAGTAWWVAGVFALYPSLGAAMSLLGVLHSLYALFLGLPKLMRPRPDAALSYFAAVLAGIGALALATGQLADRANELGGPLSTAG